MKALSIKQPWAWLIAAGYKDIENRDWPTSFRGRFLIHTGKTVDSEDRLSDYGFRKFIEHALERSYAPADALARFEAAEPTLTRGAIIGEAYLYNCVEEGWTANGSPWFSGRYGFAIRDAKMFGTPIPYRGQLGFFDVAHGGSE